MVIVWTVLGGRQAPIRKRTAVGITSKYIRRCPGLLNGLLLNLILPAVKFLALTYCLLLPYVIRLCNIADFRWLLETTAALVFEKEERAV
jgi:hypothetical protein